MRIVFSLTAVMALWSLAVSVEGIRRQPEPVVELLARHDRLQVSGISSAGAASGVLLLRSGVAKRLVLHVDKSERNCKSLFQNESRPGDKMY